jgi:Ig-like domain from next to BRCA1 gene
MTAKHKYAVLAVLVCVSLALAACAPTKVDEAAVATSVAMTVGAQETQQAADAPATLPPSATATLTPLVSPTAGSTKAPPTAPTGSEFCTASASFVSETVPDGTIYSPGAAFLKTWRIKNTGTCPWYKTWKWVWMSGDLMGAAAVYDFPQPAQPGDTVDVPIALVAPLASGEYKGFWKIQSPWGYIFGDEGSGNAFWVDIVVGSATPGNIKTATVYGITNVTYTIERTCTTANTFWHIYVNLTSNGPVDAIFNVVQSDGNGQKNIDMSFTSATTQTYDYGVWSQRFTSSTTTRWVKATVTSPTYHEWPESDPMYLCP